MNYYEILGVGPNATDQEIKEAYRREAMKWHPDRHNGAAAKGEADRRFKDLAVAYRTLRDPSARADYNRQLEQKLRHEYEARQQAQERQQRAKNEQAQREQSFKRQARPGQHGPDFEDTKTPYEDETASSEDANQVFYEQMLDLAMELAGRGFPEFNIYKALVALGCPENIAKSVTASAIQSTKQKTDPDEHPRNQSAENNATAPLDLLETANWDEVAPYYAAAIGGVHAVDRMNDTDYQYFNRRNILQLKSYGISLLIVLVGFLVAIKYTHSGFFAVLLGGICFLCTAIWRAITSNKKYRREKAIRYYLSVFECFHNAHPVQRWLQKWNIWSAVFSVSWLAYRKMVIPALVFICIWPIYTFIFLKSTEDMASSWLTFLLYFDLPGIIFGFYSNKIYYQNVRNKVRKTLSLPQKQSLILLRQKGGKSYLFVIAAFVISIVVSIPVNSLVMERFQPVFGDLSSQSVSVKANDENHQSVTPPIDQASAEVELNQLISQIETNHAELNEKSANYNQAAVDWITARQESYINQGHTIINALKLAVADYDTGSK